MLGLLSVFSFDVLALGCLNRGDGAYFTTVYIWSLIPITLAILIICVGVIRSIYIRLVFGSGVKSLVDVQSLHIWLLLFLSYTVLPPVSNKQLEAFDCIALKSGERYLRADTYINCDDNDYIHFRNVNSIFIAVYQSIPIIWIVLLYRIKDALNPPNSSDDQGLANRDKNPNLASLQFLFRDYRCSKWWFEVVDMYRRIIFIGVLPLVSSRPAVRSSFGCILAIMSVAYFREEQPYRVEFTNVIAHIAQVYAFACVMFHEI